MRRTGRRIVDLVARFAGDGNLDTELLRGFWIGDLHIDPRNGQVSGPVGSGSLAPTAVEVLLCLASQPGQLVTRETLLESVWGAGSGNAEALNRTIGELRQALDDQPDHPKYIQTVPRRGYRLLVIPAKGAQSSQNPERGAPSDDRTNRLSVFENLKARGVFETAGAYLVIGWLLIQIADIVFARLLLPEWAATFVTSCVIAGFPIAILLSWFVEFRGGRARVHEPTREDQSRHRFGRRYIEVVGALAIAAALVTVYDW